uniref:Phage portal protein n=1 Tax=Heterorhabditis bacteriophora TaxID=37862 RepID=A0A1I7WLQ5_HETBA
MQLSLLNNAFRVSRKGNTAERTDGIIRRLSEGRRQLTARDIHNEMKIYPESGLESKRTPVERRGEGGAEAEIMQY